MLVNLPYMEHMDNGTLLDLVGFLLDLDVGSGYFT